MEIRLFPYGLISLEPLFLTPTYSLPHPFATLPTLVLVSYDLPELVPSEQDTYFRQPFLFPKGEEAAFVVAPVPTDLSIQDTHPLSVVSIPTLETLTIIHHRPKFQPH
jgi:hypothetical protein